MLADDNINLLPSIRSDLQKQKSVTKFTIESILNEELHQNTENYDDNEEEKIIDTALEANESDDKMDSKSDDNENSKDFPSTPSYTAIIAKAILSSSENKLSLGSIYDYIATNFPEFLKKGQGWRNCVRHNLSLSECFVKAGRAKNGRGNYWGIHPRYIQNFLKGDYRKRRASHRPRQKSYSFSMHSYQSYLLNQSLYSIGVTNKYYHPSPYFRNEPKNHVRHSCSCCIEYPPYGKYMRCSKNTSEIQYLPRHPLGLHEKIDVNYNRDVC